MGSARPTPHAIVFVVFASFLSLTRCGGNPSPPPETSTAPGAPLAAGASAAAARHGGLTPLPEIDFTGWPEAITKDVVAAQRRAKQSPNDPEAVGELGMRLYVLEFHGAANACFERAGQLDPKSLKWAYYEALAFGKTGDAPRAIDALRRASSIDPGYAPVLTRLSDFLLPSDPVKATELARRAAELSPDDPFANFALGQCAKRQGRRDEAIEHYRRAIELAPNYAEAHYAIAMLLSAKGERAEAAQHLRQYAAGGAPSLTGDPLHLALFQMKHNTPVLRQQADMLARAGEVGGAVKILGKAILQDESGTASHIQLGVILARQGKFEDAAEQFREALKADPKNVEARSSLGLALADLGRKDEAERVYREVLKQHPDHAPTLVYLGQLLSRQGKTKEALDSLRRGVELQPANGMYQYALGDLLTRAGENEEAITHLRKAAHLMPQQPVVHFSLGVLLAGKGDRSGAKGAWQQAIQANPSYAEAWAALAGAALQENDVARAIPSAERACELTGYSKPAYLEMLARAYKAAGRLEDAGRVMAKLSTLH